MSLKILHGADFHMDSPFRALPAPKAQQRRQEQRAMLERLCALANREKVDAVLLAGDLLDSAMSYHETIETLSDTLGRIAAPVFIAPGNHDYWASASPYAVTPLPENVTVFRPGAFQSVTAAEKGFRVWGTAYQGPASPDMLQGFSVPPSELIELIVLHGDMTPKSRYCPITEEDIAASGADYIALGHIHTQSGLQRAGRTHYAWPGCVEGRGFDETGEKGVYLAEIDKGSVQLSFIPMGGRVCREDTIPLEEASNPARALSALLDGGSDRDIRRVTFTGTHRGAVPIGELTAAFSDRVFYLELRDETAEPVRLWDGAGEDSLRGLTLQQLKAAYDAAGDAAERERVTLAVRYALAAMENGEASV